MIDTANRSVGQSLVRAFRGEPGLAAAKAYNDMSPATWHQADAVVAITNQINSVGVVDLVNEGCVVDMRPAEPGIDLLHPLRASAEGRPRSTAGRAWSLDPDGFGRAKQRGDVRASP